jgi:hypothetical protein
VQATESLAEPRAIMFYEMSKNSSNAGDISSVAKQPATIAKSETVRHKPIAPSHLQVGVGIFDVDKPHQRALVQLEYRFEPHFHHIRPLVALMATNKRSVFLCAGAGWDIFLGKRVVITPSFAPGLYYHGRGKNLGFPLNFRSSIDVAFVLGNKGRVGVQFFHISNARLFLHNPGVDCLIFYYAIPFFHKKGKK